MLPFFDRPFLVHLLEDLSQVGLERVLFTDVGLGGDIQRYFGDGKSFGVHLEYLTPRQWNGTAGAVASLLDENSGHVSSPFFVIYGDSLLRMDFEALLNVHRANLACMTLACHRPRLDAFLFDDGAGNEPRTNFGVAQLETNGRITRFEEKPILTSIPLYFSRPVASAAVYLIDPDKLRVVPRPNQPTFDFAYDVIPALIANGEIVAGLDISPGFRVDLGTLSHYLSFHLATLRRQVLVDVPVLRSTEGIHVGEGATVSQHAKLVPPVFIGTGSRIERGAVIEAAVVGERSVVEEGATVRESVLHGDVTVGAAACVEGSILGAHTLVARRARVPRGTTTGSWSQLGGDELVLGYQHIVHLVEGERP
jgi:NDP-sugar pyrophosphorylase family protein